MYLKNTNLGKMTLCVEDRPFRDVVHNLDGKSNLNEVRCSDWPASRYVCVIVWCLEERRLLFDLRRVVVCKSPII